MAPPLVVHTAIGFLAGSSGAIAAYPIDYVKSQLQTEKGREKWNGGWEAARDIVQEGGPFALYRGVMVNIVGVAPEKTIKLGVNSYLRNAITASATFCATGCLPLGGEIVAGGIAGMTQVIVTNPLEVVKVRMQTSQMTIGEVLSQMKSLADVYEGVEACVVRDAVFSAALFPLYAHAKVAIATTLIASMSGGEAAAVNGDGGAVAAATFWANLIAGSVAAAPAAFIATPADVVKTRMQQAKVEEDDVAPSSTGTTTQATPSSSSSQRQMRPTVAFSTTLNYRTSKPPSLLSAEPSSSSRQEKNKPTSSDGGFLGVASDIIANEGPVVLFSGWAERVVRSVPQFGVTLAVFDVLTTMAIHRGMLPLETLS
eukprot:CAMPEP_0195298964 /NCGR_PEP_ID=MMETSP0707-20130614/24561_1 /TAXON_ID=33640 /ORGANISM="Asterionellopsis glacialis, Strain CCMP134" /LENGTH=369 /DNA_ID=CAMNT_0040361219 /DNA_START=118 /DNA_END=1227 /DNA_ORIENTATION=+